jgi:hypothetical protein
MNGIPRGVVAQWERFVNVVYRNGVVKSNVARSAHPFVEKVNNDHKIVTNQS